MGEPVYEIELEVIENEFVIDGSCESTEDVMNRVGWELDNLIDGNYTLTISENSND